MSSDAQSSEMSLYMRASASNTAYRTRHSELLADAVKALTEAGRLTWPGTGSDGQPVAGRADWTDFVTSALAGAAANIGGIEPALAGRPSSWGG